MKGFVVYVKVLKHACIMHVDNSDVQSVISTKIN